MKDVVYTISQLSKKYKISKQRIYTLLKNGKLKKHENTFERILISEGDFITYKNSTKPRRGKEIFSIYENICPSCLKIKKAKLKLLSIGLISPPTLYTACQCTFPTTSFELVYKGLS